jgi:hypothetical protein
MDELVPDYLAGVPDTGYGKMRQFHYYRAGTPPWPPQGKPNGAWEYWLGKAPYTLVVEQVPAGTLVYRPTRSYDDLSGGRIVEGTEWGHTYAD